MTTVTIVTQTRITETAAFEFGRLQAEMSAAVAQWPGFVEQTVLPPHPPVQPDWVILQRFRGEAAATEWLHSSERAAVLQRIQPLVAGPDDVHLVRDEAAGPLPAPVSIVFSTRVKPGAEAAYKLWEQKVAAAQAQARGFQGYRFEAPIPGVQDDYVGILRFESQAALQGWMDSPERTRLLTEAEPLTVRVGSRVVQAGFSQWFPAGAGAQAPGWKQNMVVLMLLYPTVFLFGMTVQTPVMMQRMGMPFWLALFLANAVSILVLSLVVPRVSGWLGWWLKPDAARSRALEVAGVAVVAGIYAVWLAVFARL